MGGGHTEHAGSLGCPALTGPSWGGLHVCHPQAVRGVRGYKGEKGEPAVLEPVRVCPCPVSPPVCGVPPHPGR